MGGNFPFFPHLSKTSNAARSNVQRDFVTCVCTRFCSFNALTQRHLREHPAQNVRRRAHSKQRTGSQAQCLSEQRRRAAHNQSTSYQGRRDTYRACTFQVNDTLPGIAASKVLNKNAAAAPHTVRARALPALYYETRQNVQLRLELARDSACQCRHYFLENSRKSMEMPVNRNGNQIPA